MHYVFFDESWQDKELWIPVIVVPQASYNAHIKTVKFGSKRNWVAEIDELLREVNGYGSLCRIQLEDHWLIEKTTDSCTDIPRMARRDNFWSWSAAYGIDMVLIQAEKKRQRFSAVDIYHDPKTLTISHRKAFHELLRTHLAGILKGLRKKGLGLGFKGLRIRRIESMQKATDVATENKFQKGIWMADQFAKHADPAKLGQFPNLQAIDVTRYIRTTIKRWKDGDLT